MASSSSSSLLYLSCLLILTSSAAAAITIPLTRTFTHPSSDRSQILYHLASLSRSRAYHLKSPTTNLSSSLIKVPLFPRSYGGYSISLSFGTPPQTTKFLMDTGSSLVWFPCTSRYLCSSCNFPSVEPKIPVFIPKLSSSSKLIGCKNSKCEMIFGKEVKCRDCDVQTQNCTQACPAYIIQYGLGSTAGLLLSENLDFPDKVIPDFVVGCSILSTRQPEGIAGFGRRPESLPSQLGLNKFSYCLVSHRFDDSPVSSDLVLDTGSSDSSSHEKPKSETPGLKYTPFQKNPNASNSAFQDYYYVPLRKIIVGGQRVKIPHSYLTPTGPSGNGGTIVDSGSTFTFLEKPVFELVAREFETQMANFTVSKEAESATHMRPCFNISGEKSLEVPELTFQFKGAAKMTMPLPNYFAFVDKDIFCLTLVSDNVVGPGVRGGPAIILGNFQQQNFYIEYDLKNNRFGFKQQNCV